MVALTVLTALIAALAASDSAYARPAVFNAKRAVPDRATPAATLSPPPFPAVPTGASAPTADQLIALAQGSTTYDDFLALLGAHAGLDKRQWGASGDLNALELWEQVLSYRATAAPEPTVGLGPGQLARQSLVSARYASLSRAAMAFSESSVSSSRAAAEATRTTSGAQADPTCALTADCANDVPDFANRLPHGLHAVGLDLRSGILVCTVKHNHNEACDYHHDDEIPDFANRYCDNGSCSWRCRSGYSSTGTGCVAESSSTTTTTQAPTTTTTSAAPTSTTCAVTADCTNSVPDFANRYCDNGVCSFRWFKLRLDGYYHDLGRTCRDPDLRSHRRLHEHGCRSGYTASGSICVGAVGSATRTSSNAASTNTGLSWAEQTTFSTLDEFKSDVITNGRFGWGETQGNVAVVGSGVPAERWTGGTQGDSGSALQVAFPAGSRNPSASPVGGMGFYTSQIDVSQANNVSFSYSVFFEEGFNFVKGGKLPGLYGGRTACSGGSTAETCFSARLMWRTNGMGELYLYAPREKQVDALCTLGPLSYCNSVYGMSIGRGSWTFKTGEWTDIRQDIWLNTPGQPDGGFNIWVNNELVLSSSSVYYRNSETGMIGNGTAGNDTMILIDYDSIPDSITIPNGGFKTYPNTSAPVESGVFQPSYVTKVVRPTATASYADDATSLPYDWEVRRRNRERRSVVPLGGPTTIVARAQPKPTAAVPLEKRQTFTPVPGFLGAMAQTFFGGSSVDYNSPTLQYTYFRGFGLRINP
ncbi:hypothetical protein Rhopal_001746-T1 [Rhodotorula paludigena]|uniref:Polysaccharide lyase 14 domain-containing protein n=1 Tax=Rhodotorula paludigena TaxID=86838 RepID=A0AAV5GI72_9BASI|nr:hypothetical protein Rhopal_001746-T1 [Rhodotorula paludigena]